MIGRHNGLPSAQVTATAIFAAGFIAMLAANLPGHLSYDSILQLLEGRSGHYANWHPAVMSWMLGISDSIFAGAGVYVVGVSALAFGSLIRLLWLKSHVSWWAVLATLVICALPQLFLYQGIVWKDVLFANACLAAFASLACAASTWNNPARRYGWLAASAFLFSLAILSRQNGFVVGIFAALALAAISGRAQGWRKSVIVTAAFVAAVFLLAGSFSFALQMRSSDSTSATRQIEYLQLYDIAGMLRRDPMLAIPKSREAPGLMQFMQARSAALYAPLSQDALIDNEQFLYLANGKAGAVGQIWRATVSSNPLTYLKVRLKDFEWVALSLHPKECVAFVVGVNGEPDILSQLKLARRYNVRDSWLDRGYGRKLLGTPLFSHPLFALGGLACLLLLYRRREPADFAIMGMLLGAFAYCLSYYFLSVACDYRYLYVLDLSVIAAGLYLVKDWQLALAGDEARDIRERLSSWTAFVFALRGIGGSEQPPTH